jgi:hypothetical protein
MATISASWGKSIVPDVFAGLLARCNEDPSKGRGFKEPFDIRGGYRCTYPEPPQVGQVSRERYK